MARSSLVNGRVVNVLVRSGVYIMVRYNGGISITGQKSEGIETVSLKTYQEYNSPDKKWIQGNVGTFGIISNIVVR